MDFSLTEEQSALLEAVGAILGKRDADTASSDGDVDTALWRDLADGAMLSLVLPEAQGGLGFGALELALVLESCGKRLARVPLLEHSVALHALSRYADAEYSDPLLSAAAGGSLVLSAALFGADPAQTDVRAERADGEYVLSGRARFVPFGREADRILLTVRVDEAIALAVIDPSDPAVDVVDLGTTSGRAEADLVIDGLRVDASAVFGDGDAVTAVWQRAVVGTCALLIGVAGRALEMTVAHVNSREQFGRTLSTFQAVAIHVGSAYIDLECARVTALEAAWLLDDKGHAEREASIAKYWASTASARIARTAQHLHGGIGVTREFPLHRYFLWARHLQLWCGAAPLHISRLRAHVLAPSAATA